MLVQEFHYSWTEAASLDNNDLPGNDKELEITSRLNHLLAIKLPLTQAQSQNLRNNNSTYTLSWVTVYVIKGITSGWLEDPMTL